ncbi:MAG: hypothetical protein ACRDZ8_19690 [Acidimicrobiales bacterium]
MKFCTSGGRGAMVAGGRGAMVALVVVALAATGCTGAAGGKKAASPSASTTVTTSIAPTTTSAATSTAALSGVVVQTSDLPTGWMAEGPSIPEGAFVDVASQLAHCLAVRDVTPDVTASTQSGPFTQGEEIVVSTAASFSNDTDVAAETAMLTNPKFTKCFDQAASGASYGGATIQSATATVEPGRGSGPANVAGSLHVSYTGTYFSQGVQSTADVVLITGPRLLVTIEFFGITSSVPTAVEASVIAKVAARAATG